MRLVHAPIGHTEDLDYGNIYLSHHRHGLDFCNPRQLDGSHTYVRLGPQSNCASHSRQVMTYAHNCGAPLIPPILMVLRWRSGLEHAVLERGVTEDR